MEYHHISAERLTIARVREILERHLPIALSDDAKRRIVRCREYLDRKMENPDRPIYGITTGFGSLCDISIGRKDLAQLQRNLVMSHACGTGERVPSEIVRLILLFKIQSLAYGYSGVQLATVERLVEFFNRDILPVVYQQGSLGASGDLAPLAHLSLPLLGLGEVEYKGEVRPAGEVLAELGWEPIELQSKAGLALLNGTQFMSAYGVWSVIAAQRLSEWADRIGALSLDAFDGRIEPFCDEVHVIRAHKGQLTTARAIRHWLEGSELIARPKKHVQDPYSFRCIPQVHGASKDTIDYVAGVLETEINSPTDNPTVFPEEDMVVSAGNFHGQPIALAMDFLAIALAELGNISERRTYQLISGARELPKFLVANPGLNSGFMIPQYTAASIVSQTKGLCMPASVDSIPSSQGQEDHVSMGSNAATKLWRVVGNTERVLAIELFNAAQALEFRRPARTSPALERMVAEYRRRVPFIDNDQVMYPHIAASVEFLREQR
ncbi:MAG TPA: histidine ammonia-lyase [Candidatus Alistipes intestinigallinarum]|uniref:Histidine ammonia-lyase n=1 Tax=Candidatus Alistipes intestinigallinarum TaxID=2838440 RepID=A0A9D2CBJ9_9BACT|nr:histidine ammonia-lyase [Candidatus Alistipes intestinigallinarum]